MADPSRTETPTPRRRERVREEGHIARSSEPGAALGLLGALIALVVFGPASADRLQSAAVEALSQPQLGDLTAEVAVRAAGHFLGVVALAVLPLAAVALILGVAASAAQVGLMIAPAALKPDFTRLNPVKGLGRIFSQRLLMESLKVTCKMAAVGLALWLSLRSQQDLLLGLPGMAVGPGALAIGRVALAAAAKAGVVLLIFAGIDYAYQRFEFEKEIRVTPYELKRDLRETEGDPLLRSRLRGLRRDLLNQGVSDDMPKADLVVTNPVRIAVALWYDPALHTAPVIVAKGRKAVARRIVELAMIHSIPVRQNIPVAQALDKVGRLGKKVPPRLYRVVAELLAALYRARRRPGRAPSSRGAWRSA